MADHEKSRKHGWQIELAATRTKAIPYGSITRKRKRASFSYARFGVRKRRSFSCFCLPIFSSVPKPSVGFVFVSFLQLRKERGQHSENETGRKWQLQFRFRVTVRNGLSVLRLILGLADFCSRFNLPREVPSTKTGRSRPYQNRFSSDLEGR